MESEHAPEKGHIDGDKLARKIEAWIRHGEAVPSDVTTYERWIVNTELRGLIEECRVTSAR